MNARESLSLAQSKRSANNLGNVKPERLAQWHVHGQACALLREAVWGALHMLCQDPGEDK